MSSNLKLSVKIPVDNEWRMSKRLCNRNSGFGEKFYNFANGNVMINLDANSIRENDSSMFSIFLVKHLDVTQTS